MKLQENTCFKCGQPTTTTQDFITQTWDLTPIPRADATWVAFLSRPVLAITTNGQRWHAHTARTHHDLPNKFDTNTWLTEHRCHHPPIPEAGNPITLTPPTVEIDLFNQADDQPPY
ncbi:hypothetical protein [Flaviflexus massiliensis]|uniref:hypothetical protein n=1 Tax=Flaviflexus massiliensis TaxID=1522309 RepID=UPI0006D57E5E|nr:hypothetical protein [Flaviflexus massiliensis]